MACLTTFAAPMNVLVADDDRLTRAVLKRILIAELGCSVTEVTDGAAALEALGGGTFDLLVLDLQMPVLGGVETLRALRTVPALQALPVVVLTADGSEATVREVLEQQVTDYLRKPLDAARVADRLRRVMGGMDRRQES